MQAFREKYLYFYWSLQKVKTENGKKIPAHAVEPRLETLPKPIHTAPLWLAFSH